MELLARRSVMFAAALVMMTGWAAIADPVDDDTVKRFYFEGLDEVTATFKASKIETSSKAMPCANCHGADGRGGREGGILVPPIDWRRLAIATIERPAYDEAGLVRAITEGIGADGAQLHDIMPRYDLTAVLAASLPNFLADLTVGTSAGVTESQITIAVPKGDANARRQAVVGKVLRDYVEQLNQKGGIYGRDIILIDDDVATDDNALGRLGGLTPRPEATSEALDLWPLENQPGQKSDTALIPSDERQLARLLKEARLEDTTAERTSSLEEIAEPYPKALVFDGRPEQLEAFARGWSGPARPTIYTTTRHADPKLIAGLSSRPLRIAIANPLPADPSSDDINQHQLGLQEAAERLGLTPEERPIARAAWVIATLFEHALRDAGRQLDRERLMAVIRAMPALETGLLPPVNPIRGIRLIDLVLFDLETRQIERQRLVLE